MNLHSTVDIITNSSSVSYIYPKDNILNDINNSLKQIFGEDVHVEVNLSKVNIKEIINRYGQVDTFDMTYEDSKKTIEFIKNLKGNEQYEYVNNLFKSNKFCLIYYDDADIDPFYTRNHIEVSLVVNGQKIDVAQVLKTIYDSMFRGK